MPEPAFEFVGVGAGGPRQLERERVPEVVGSQGADPTAGIGNFRVVSPADVFQDAIDRSYGQPPIFPPGTQRSGAQQQRGGGLGGVAWTFLLQVVGLASADRNTVR